MEFLIWRREIHHLFPALPSQYCKLLFILPGYVFALWLTAFVTSVILYYRHRFLCWPSGVAKPTNSVSWCERSPCKKPLLPVCQLSPSVEGNGHMRAFQEITYPVMCLRAQTPRPSPSREPFQTWGCWFGTVHNWHSINGLTPKVSSRALKFCSVFPRLF